uniref:Uncharacterized protein n=1 Tax=Cacopsylla melanoneura TaxID=428564 RepID=A0A8D8VYL5_9HEMI
MRSEPKTQLLSRGKITARHETMYKFAYSVLRKASPRIPIFCYSVHNIDRENKNPNTKLGVIKLGCCESCAETKNSLNIVFTVLFYGACEIFLLTPKILPSLPCIPNRTKGTTS